jgi:hypothetical protein
MFKKRFPPLFLQMVGVGMDLKICKICKEPVQNFICVDCLKEDISGISSMHIRMPFLEFHEKLKSHFGNPLHKMTCMNCGENDVSVCPYCYLNEVFFWMLKEDAITAKRIMRMLPMFRHNEPMEFVEMNFMFAITETKNSQVREGVCERCGEFSDYLKEGQEGWTCAECITKG